MWGFSEDVEPDFAKIHVSLVDRLSDLTWSRVQIWHSNTSVHEWTLDGHNYAFDILYRHNNIHLSLITRTKENHDRLREACSLESVPFTEVDSRPNRLLLASIETKSINEILIDSLVHLIRKSRRAVELNIHEIYTYNDPENGHNINYAVKRERKSNDELIFLFTSIRTKKHWIDFDGPLGQTLKSNRSRIIFVYDDFENQYNYHFASNGETKILQSTLGFIRQYIHTNGYSMSKVTLAGMSKGGTAAILIGSKIPGSNVVALAPQLALGNYLIRSNRSEILSQMSGLESIAGARRIDILMWDTLSETSHIGMSSCTVLTSANDVDCFSELARFKTLMEIRKVDIDVYVDDSEYTTDHLKTVHHLMPTFVSILGCIAGGLRPKF